MHTRNLPTRLLKSWLIALLFGVLSACAGKGVPPKPVLDKDGAPSEPIDIDSIPDPIPRAEPRSRYGNPPFYIQDGRRYDVLASSTGYTERGIASWYGTKFHGRRTSSGEPYDLYAMTAAHRTLPLPTYAYVTNLRNGRSVTVRINDRGPFKDARLIDLSYAAATKLGILSEGTGLVEVRAIDVTDPGYQAATATPSLPVPRTSLYLQIGAFANPQNAERLRLRLQDNDFANARIAEGYGSDNTRVFRVRVGPIASAEDADRVAAKLAELGINDSHIVID